MELNRKTLGIVIVSALQSLVDIIARPAASAVIGVEYNNGTKPVMFIVDCKTLAQDLDNGLSAIADYDNVKSVGVIMRETLLSSITGNDNDIDVPLNIDRTLLDKILSKV